jgi:hypothetical protein
MRQIEDALDLKQIRTDIITCLPGVTTTKLCLTNNVSNLVKNWPTHPRITPEDNRSLGFHRDQGLNYHLMVCN